MYIENVLLVAFLKYILTQLHDHCNQNWIFCYFFEVENFVSWRKIFLDLLLFMIFLPKKQQNWFFKNFHNLGAWLAVESWAIAPLNCIFSALSIGLQFTLSFEWVGFSLNCTATVMSKDQSPTVKVIVCNIPVS